MNNIIKVKYGMGWIPDKPDHRDYTMKHPTISHLLTKIGIVKKDPIPTTPPTRVDLREWCSPIENQGDLGSCTANSGAGLIEYFERRAFGKYFNGSRLFLYKVTRNLMGLSGDTGAEIRSTIGSIVMLGIPPEKYMPYDTKNYDNEPTAMCYALAADYKAVKYLRLDTPNIAKNDLLTKIKINIAAGIPSMFGFTVYESYKQAENDGKIPFPSTNENQVGGHAIVAIGYDDSMVTTNNIDKKSTTGAFLIRNSWGTKWGNGGYGNLPYEYVLQELAMDWWTLISTNWIDTGNFGF